MGLGNGVLGHLAIGSTRSTPVESCAIRSCMRWTGRHRMSLPRCTIAEDVDTLPLLAEVKAPVLLLSGDKSPIASAQQKTLAQTLPNGRLELLTGYGHGANLLQPERCARIEFGKS